MTFNFYKRFDDEISQSIRLVHDTSNRMKTKEFVEIEFQWHFFRRS